MFRTAIFTTGPHWKYPWYPLTGKWMNKSWCIYPVLRVCVCVRVRTAAGLCLTLCDPTDCGLPGSSVHGIIPKNTGAGYHVLLQGIFPTQGLNPSLLHLLPRQRDSLPMGHLGSRSCAVLATVSMPWNTGSGSPMRLQLRKAELEAPQGSSRAAEAASKTAPSSGCWQETSAPSQEVPFMELHECLYDTATDFWRWAIHERGPLRPCLAPSCLEVNASWSMLGQRLLIKRYGLIHTTT